MGVIIINTRRISRLATGWLIVKEPGKKKGGNREDSFAHQNKIMDEEDFSKTDFFSSMAPLRSNLVCCIFFVQCYITPLGKLDHQRAQVEIDPKTKVTKKYKTSV